MPAPYEKHRAQLKAILLAWGMPEENAEATADILSWADLHGVDSHGISMIPGYDQMRRSGRANMEARPRIIRETPVSALVDGDGGLGHVPARFAMQVAIDKAKAAGIAITAGAQLGAFRRHRLLHVDGGQGGADRHGVHQQLVAPGRADLWQGGKARHRPVVVRRADRRREAVSARHGDDDGRRRPHPQQGRTRDFPARPAGCWTRTGGPAPTPLEAREKGGFLTSLGGSPETSSYKGYGLAVMVNILGACLSGASLITDPMHRQEAAGQRYRPLSSSRSTPACSATATNSPPT